MAAVITQHDATLSNRQSASILLSIRLLNYSTMNDPEAGVKKHHDEKDSPPVITPADGQVVDASLRTQRGIKTRHALMTAIGGTIGTGLFVGTGEALAIAGPAPLLGVCTLSSAFSYTALSRPPAKCPRTYPYPAAQWPTMPIGSCLAA